MNKKKIAIYDGAIPSTTFVERLIEGVSKSDHEVYLFGRKVKKKKYKKGVTVFGYSSGKRRFLYYLKYAILLSIFKRRDKKKLLTLFSSQPLNWHKKLRYYPVLYHCPDLFHIQWAKNLNDWMWLKEFGVKIVLSLRGAHINYSPIADSELAKSYQLNFPKIDGYHAVSKAIGKEAEKYGADPEKIKVVYSGLNLNDFPFTLNTPKEEIPSLSTQNSAPKTQNSNLSTHNSKLTTPPSKLSLLSLGRAHWKKGYHYALETAAILKQKGLDFHYTIIGGADDEELLFLQNQMGLKDCVSLKGRIPFSEVKELIQSTDLLLLPSVEEGVANVVLEAMALGLPVISTNCGGMEEALSDGVNGWVVPLRDPHAMADKIEIVSNLLPEELNQIRLSARKTIEKQHQEHQMVEGMMGLYAEVLK